MSASASALLFGDRPTLADARFGADPMSAVWWLASRSELHRKWAVSEIERLFRPAITTGQIRFYWTGEGEPAGLATWMELPLQAIQDLVFGTLRLEHRHWTGYDHWPVHHTLHTLIVDMIASPGTCRLIVNDLRAKFRGKTCFARRTTNGKRRLAMFRGYDDVAIRAA